MRVSKADEYFSKCVRESHNHTCEKCGKQGRMETSHVFSRRHRTIRWDALNANCLCHGCHRKWHESPLESYKWFCSEFGEWRYEVLKEKRDSKVKVTKLEEKDIAAHYRKQLKIMEDKRLDGDTGRLDFESWQ